MNGQFDNRRVAGRQLAQRFRGFRGRRDLIVLGLPRGGIPVAGELAAALEAPLYPFVVRKIGVPGHRELAMGAVASGGIRVVNETVVHAMGVSRLLFDDISAEETREVQRQERLFHMEQPLPDLRDATVILVDDGVATGSTMLAGIHALRQLGPARIIAAAPVMSREAFAALARVADACECVTMPEDFQGVGAHYHDFMQTTDDEVREVLRKYGGKRSWDAKAGAV